MRKPLALLSATMLALTLAGCAADAGTTTGTDAPVTPDATEPSTAESDTSDAGTDITLTTGDTVITATLNDSQVSQDFIAMLPVTLPWFRNYGIEYISELSAPLTEDGPFYTDVQPGDLVYYNPADSITIIYEETSSVPTLTYMGEITSDLSVFEGLPDDIELEIALAQ